MARKTSAVIAGGSFSFCHPPSGFCWLLSQVIDLSIVAWPLVVTEALSFGVGITAKAEPTSDNSNTAAMQTDFFIFQPHELCGMGSQPLIPLIQKMGWVAMPRSG